MWYKIRKDRGSDGRGVGFYFRGVTELVLFGVRGSLRTSRPGFAQVNLLKSQKREHSRKPDELYGIIEACSPGPYLELFARHQRENWTQWGDGVCDDSSNGSTATLATSVIDPAVSISTKGFAYEQDRMSQSRGLFEAKANLK